MRILVVNPNTTDSMTQRIAAAARAVASPTTQSIARPSAHGPASIEGYFDEVFAAPGMLEEMLKGEADGAVGYVVACFDDIVLGCAGLADLADSLAREHGVPVIDGVGAAVKLLEALGGLGLATSKRGPYAPPLRKRFMGAFAALGEA